MHAGTHPTMHKLVGLLYTISFRSSFNKSVASDSSDHTIALSGPLVEAVTADVNNGHARVITSALSCLPEHCLVVPTALVWALCITHALQCRVLHHGIRDLLQLCSARSRGGGGAGSIREKCGVCNVGGEGLCRTLLSSRVHGGRCVSLFQRLPCEHSCGTHTAVSVPPCPP